MSDPAFYSDGYTPRRMAPALVVLQKILGATIDLSGGGGSGSGTFSGAGSPQGSVTASPGATYLDTSTGNFWSKQTGAGNSGWLELIGN